MSTVRTAAMMPAVRLDAALKPASLRFRAPRSATVRFDASRTASLKKTAPAEILIMKEIGPEEWGLVDAKLIRRLLKEAGEKTPIDLIINSPGGDAFEGFAIYNLLRDHQAKVSVKVFGMAASAASIITMAGDRVEMGEASFIMIHSAAGMVWGNAEDMASFADLLNKIDGEAAAVYSRRTGMKVDDVLAMMRKETWMTAKEAVEKGFADVAVAEPDAKKEKSNASSTKQQSAAQVVSLAQAAREAAMRAASGNPTSSRPSPSVAMSASAQSPGVAGLYPFYSIQGNLAMKNPTLQEAIAVLLATREQKCVRMGEIMELKRTENRRLSEEEAAEVDTLTQEVADIDDDLREKRTQLVMAAAARPAQGSSSETAALSRGSNRILLARDAPEAPFLNLRNKDQDEKFKGQNFTRGVIAKALAYLHHRNVADIAEERWGKSNPTLVKLIRMAGVPGAGSGSGEWGSELVQADTRYTGDFLEYLYAATIFDQLNLREVPANVTIKGTDGAATGYWVGQSKGIPATSGSASSVSLTPLKVAALAVVSNELLEDSSPAAEQWIRDLLVNACSQRVDQTFLSSDAAVSGVSPAGLLNGVSGTASAGATADNLRTDIEVLYAAFIAARDASEISFITTTGLAKAIQLLRNSLGQREFPDVVSAQGRAARVGSLEGDPLFRGDNVTSGHFIAIKTSEVWKIGDSGLRISVSRDATIEQDTAPSGETDTPAAMSNNMTSMFQEESTAIKIVRRINFQKRRPHAVQLVTGANYGGTAS